MSEKRYFTGKPCKRGRYTQGDIHLIKKRQGNKCVGPQCSASVEIKYHIDHRIPISLGGSNDPKNIDILCPGCNMRKNAKHPIVFAQENGMLL